MTARTGPLAVTLDGNAHVDQMTGSDSDANPSATPTLIRSGKSNAQTWKLYSMEAMLPGQRPHTLYVCVSRGVAYWDDKMLTLVDCVDDDSGQGAGSVVADSRSIYSDSIRVNADESAPMSESFCLQLSLGAFAHASYVARMSGVKTISLSGITSRHSMEHIESTLLGKSLTPDQQWFALYVATQHVKLSLKLVVALTKVRFHWSATGEEDQTGKYWDSAAFVSPVLLFRDDKFEALRYYGLTDTLWWYLYRLTGDFLSAVEKRASTVEATRTPVDFEFVPCRDSKQVQGVDSCSDCPVQDEPIRLADHTGSLAWDDFEFFAGNHSIAAAPMDASAMNHDYYLKLKSLLSVFWRTRLSDSSPLDVSKLESLLGVDHLPCPPLVIENDAAFAPVPVGLFAAMKSRDMATDRLTAACQELILLATDGLEHRDAGQVSWLPRTREYLSRFIDPDDMDVLVESGAQLLQLRGAEAERWRQEQREDLESIWVTLPELSVDQKELEKSALLTSIARHGLTAPVIEAVRFYYEHPEEHSSMLLSWYLNLCGIDVSR